MNLTLCLGRIKVKSAFWWILIPKENATSGLGAVTKRAIAVTAYGAVLIGTAQSREEAVLHTAYRNVDLIPSASAWRGGDDGGAGAARKRRAALASLQERYDYLLIDCPVAGPADLNALCASDTFLGPSSANITRWRGCPS